MLPKKNRLKKGFHFVLRTGDKKKGAYFVIIYKQSKNKYSRFGILVTKKVGGAVLRNKIKRQVRQIIRSVKRENLAEKDFVIIPSKFIDWHTITFVMIEKDILTILSNI